MASTSGSEIRAIGIGAMTAMLFVSLTACRPAAQNVSAHSEKVPVAADAAAESRLDLSLDSASFAELNQAAVNEEFGIRAAFPEDSVVCQARSGDHPVGFGTDLDRASDCGNPRGDRLVRIVGIQASYNTYFGTSAERQLPCAAGSVPPGMNLDLREFVFPGMESVRCVSREKDGQIWVTVAALGGGLDHNDPPEPPITHRVLYWSVLGTHGAHLREDLALYREFLRRLRFLPVDMGDADIVAAYEAES